MRGVRVAVVKETADVIELTYTNDDVELDTLADVGFDHRYDYDERGGRDWHVYTLQTAKTDPRLAFELVEYHGYHLRVIERQPYGVLVVAHENLAGVLRFKVHEVAYAWLADADVRPARPRAHLIEPDRIPALAKQRFVGYAPRGEELAVCDETAHAFVLAGVGEVPKPDPIYGNGVLSWARYRGVLLRVIAEQDNELLLVAHENLREHLDFIDLGALCCAWIPRAETEKVVAAQATVVDPDVGRLQAVAHRLGGQDHVEVRGVAQPLRVLGETATMLELEQIGTIAKCDNRLMGPFAHVIATSDGFHYRIVLVLDDWYLAVVHESFPLQYKFLREPGAPVAFRWFPSRAINPVAMVDNPSTVDLSVHASVDVTIDGVVHRCPVKIEYPESLDVVLGGNDLRIDKLDPRVGGAHERIGFFDDAGRGMHVRVAGMRDGQMMLVVDDSYANKYNGWESGPGMGWRLVDPALVTEPAPSNDTLYRSQKVTLAGHEHAVQIFDETADMFVLESGSIAKTDHTLIGPYGRLVILKGNLLRVAEERRDKFLVIAHGRLGAALGFTSYTYDGHTLGWRWFLPSELDAV